MWLFRVALSGNGPSWAMRALLSLLCWRITLLYMPGKNHLTQLVDLFSRVWFENEPNCATIVHLRIPIPVLKQGKVQIFRMNSNSIMDRSLDLSLSLPLALEQDLFAQLTSRAKNLPTNIDFDNFSPDLVATMDVRVSKYLGSLSFRGKTLFYQEEDVDRYPRLYIPLVLRDAYWAMAHSSPFAGHPGLLESINNLKRFGWYDGLREDVAERIRVCHGCQLGKKEGVTLDFVRGHTFPVGFPFAKITIDFAGEYAVTERGFKYICIVQCDDTRFRVCEACSSKAAVVAARVLVYRIFTTFGAPLIIGHDQGGEFNNGLISSINELLGMNSEMSFPYQPQVIARNERSHQEDNKIIRSIGALHEWDLLVPMLQWILNIRKNASLGMSPFRALFGRDPMRIHEVAQVAFICRELQLDPAEFQHVSVEEWAERLRTEANERRALKAAADLIADEKHRGQRGRVSSWKQYGRPQVGDMVAIRATPSKSTVPNAKLARLWLGPFEITWMSPQGLSFEMVFIPDRSIVVQRPAQDVKRYFTKDNDGSVIDATQVDDYVVSEILGARGEHHDSTREYFVSWEGWPEEFNLWIAPELINDPDLIVMADRKFPPESGSRLMKSDWMTKLIPGQIATIVDEYSNRRAPGIRILLRGENQPRKLPLHFAPEVVLKMPDVAALPGVQRFLADRHIVDV